MRIVKFHNIKSYILAGKLLHIISLIEILAIILIIPELYKLEPSSFLLKGLKYYAIIFLLSLPVFSQLDARSRYQNYKQIKDQIFIYGFDARILKPIIHSRCQRDAALLSASELGYKIECKNKFHAVGYKWFHLFPDFLFTKPQFLLTVYFLKTTFFTPTYRSRINFQIEQQNQFKPNQNFETNANVTAC